ncbi:MAG: cell division protein ZipA [Gammaproteobacteria bacterium]
MNSLRVVLLVLGVVLIALIYFFGTRRRKRKQGTRNLRRPYDDIKLDMSALPSDEHTDDGDELIPFEEKALGPEAPTLPSHEGLAIERRLRITQRLRHRSGTPETTRSPQRIVSLYLIAPAGYSYEGTALTEALAAVGMHHGDMGIFHHYGVAGMSSGASLFSLANMVEPGSFEMNQMDQMTTPGLVFFMQMPSAFDAPVVFELMLHTAQRLSELLGGELKDDSRNALEADKLAELRQLVAGA